MMASLYEKRPLKKPRIGPPDVYPQEPKQKEDELNSVNVKHGFATMPQLSDEFGTARNCNVTASKVGAYFNAIIARKEELCTLPDSGRKRQQINLKDNFWPAIVRNKHCIEAWFKDLAGNKPLMALAKKAPNYNKKEEIFIMLSEYQVPMLRAAWFIKLSSAYTVAVSEAKNKKRQLPDPTTEWTSTLIKFLKDQLPKLQEHFHQGTLSTNSTDKSQTNINNSGAATTGGSTPNGAGTGSMMASTGNNVTTIAPPLQSPASQSLTTSESEFKVANRQWTYCIQLAKYMYEEGLLDRQEFLNWILELLDKLRSQPSDDGILKLFLPLALQYLDEFVQSELLSRRLAYLCSKKLTYMCNNIAENNLVVKPLPTNDTVKGDDKDRNKELTLTNPLQMTLNEYLNCPHHRDLILELSSILQVIALECPTALVWCGVGENKSSSIWHGSPLDSLPAPPSLLPLPTRTACFGMTASGASTAELRKKLRNTETEIRTRSRRAEGRWCADKWQASSAGTITNKVLAVLDALDRHRFDRMDANNSLDILYNKIFSPPGVKDTAVGCSTNSSENKESRNEYNVSQDEATIQILCEWAVSHERWGEHRAMAVAALLDRRQTDVAAAQDAAASAAITNQTIPTDATGTANAIESGVGTNNTSATNGQDDKDSVSSLNNITGGAPVFQSLLMRFLDNDAPILEENGSPQNRVMFTNLVHLFAELIRHDVFSHDAYMCTLISRGDLLAATSSGQGATNSITGGTPGGAQHRPATPALDDDMFAGIDLKPGKLDVSDHGRVMDYDDSKIDDDLDKILQHIKEDQQNSMDAPDSPKDPTESHHSHHSNMMSSGGITNIPMDTSDHSDLKIRPTRHLLYTTHFPLTQDESSSQHDCNQRHVLLYGVGKVRDEARHTVKKMSKEICKLFSKKFSIDVAEGGKVKKHSRNEFNFESTTQKCQSLSYFDQHVVTWQCSMTVIEMLNSFALGNSNYLPVQEHVAFLFDLMELALNIYGLIDVCIQILKELPEVEAQLLVKNSTLAKNYTTSLSLYVVGVLKRYHCCLLLSAEQTSAVFEGLCRVVKHVTNPADCSSAERCVLAHLYDLYSSCSLLKSKPHSETFSNAYPKIRQTLYSALTPQPSNNHIHNSQYMQDVFTNLRRGGKIEPTWARQLAESPNNRYSFVTNAVVAVCRCDQSDSERLNDLAIMCAEMTAAYNALSAEWLGALMALCCSSNPNFYTDVLTQVDVEDLSIHNSLAIFTSILIARHCFSLEDFVKHVALPSLVKLKKFNDGRGDPSLVGPGCSAEAGARLTCHLLLRLFKTVECPQPGLYSVSTSPHPMPNGQTGAYNIRLSCDRHLLAAAHNNIKVGPVLAVLKGIMAVGDGTARDNKLGNKRDTGGSGSHNNSGGGKAQSGLSGSGELSISHILGTSDSFVGGDDGMLDLTMVELESTSSRSTQRQSISSEGLVLSLSGFAWHVLREICSQQWVLERCLSQPEELCHHDLLLDPELTTQQAQRLLRMICYPEANLSTLDELDQKVVITRILENLEQWTLRMSWLDLQLMFQQFNSNSSELNQWLDTVAKAAIDVFQLNSADAYIADKANSRPFGKGKSNSIWLVAPLVSKLPSAVQGRVLKVAGQVLEQNNWPGVTSNKRNSSDGSNSKDGGGGGMRGSNQGGGNSGGNTSSKRSAHANSGSSLLSHQPFLSLVLTCLKGQDDQREGLLTSLQSQLSQFLSLNKDDRMGTSDINSREAMLDALQLRFSLVGGMFDTIQRSTTTTTDWAVLLVQLISYGVIDLNNNSELFMTVIDMLATLVHSTLVSDSQSEKDENKKHYQNLMKKLKKELGDRNSPSIQYVRQLLPLQKRTCEIIVCEPVGCLTDTKGNKITGFDSIDKKQGLRVSEKQRVSPWDLLEGQKSPAPLSWAWFGAVKMERKPLWYEDTHRLLKYHTHSLLRSPAHYLDPVPLPPEDLEPIQEKPLKDCDLKADTPSSVDQSPRSAALGKVRGKGGQRRPRKPKPGGPCTGQIGTPGAPGTPGGIAQGGAPQPMQMGQPGPGNMPTQPNPMGVGMQNMQGGQVGSHMGYGAQPGVAGSQQGFPNTQAPQQWGYNSQQQPQQGYYGQQMPNVSRFDRPQNNQSKQALSNMLRQRHPLNQFMGGTGAATGPTGPAGAPNIAAYQTGNMQRQFVRQPLRPTGPMQQHPGTGVGPGGPMGPNASSMFQQQYGNMQQGMTQNYGGYSGQQINQQMMQAAAGGGGGGPQQAGMMGGFQAGQQAATGFSGPQGAAGPPPGAMLGQRNQADYLSQQQRMGQPGPRPQYLQAPNVTMNAMGQLSGVNGNQGGPAPPYSRTGQPGVQPNQQSQQFQQQVNQQRIRQQMLVMQQQQQQQQQQTGGAGPVPQGAGAGGQPTSALVAHLQRQMQQPTQQHNPYQHQPPPY